MIMYQMIMLVLLGIMLLKQFIPALKRNLSIRRKEDEIDWIDVIIIIIIIIILFP